MRCALFGLSFAMGLAGILGGGGSSALAGQILSANYSGQISPGNANVQAPFTPTLVQGGQVGGSFAYDSDLVPGPGSGYRNAFIPDGTLFDFRLGGGLEFTQADATYPVMVQYNDGQFSGFVYQANFSFQGSLYEFDIQGTYFSIYRIINGVTSFQPLVNGYLNNGNASLTDIRPFDSNTGASAAPEPGTLALAASALPAGLGLWLRRRRKARAD